MATKKQSKNSRQDKVQAAKKGSGSPGTGAVSAIAVGAGLLIVGIIAVVFFVVWGQMQKDSKVSASTEVPAGAGEMGKGFVANPDVELVEGAPTFEIYEDFQCPACAVAENQLGPSITKMADAGQIKLVYHFKTIIDSNMGTTHSLNTANAALCAADQGGFKQFHAAVYANEPAQEGQGWTADQLKGFATGAGITGDKLTAWQQCVDDKQYNAYVQSVDEASAKNGVNGTPSFFLNGNKFELTGIRTVADFEQRIQAANTAKK